MTKRRALQASVWKVVLVAVTLLGWGLFSPWIGQAQTGQSASPAAASALNPQQGAGKRLFMQNCSLCHLPRSKNSKSNEDQHAYGGDLKGLFKGQKPLTEQAVETFIRHGLPKKMPGFQYGLKPEEIDNIIAYLKTQ